MQMRMTEEYGKEFHALSVHYSHLMILRWKWSGFNLQRQHKGGYRGHSWMCELKGDWVGQVMWGWVGGVNKKVMWQVGWAGKLKKPSIVPQSFWNCMFVCVFMKT